MFIHNLKIAFRNMRKYFNQTLISVIGLAVGFTCFALATLWIRYEMSFDGFHKNAKQLYVIYKPDSFNPSGYSKNSHYPLAAHLKETFPEILNASTTSFSYRKGVVTVEDVEFPAMTIMADSSFFKIFDVKILEGSMDFLNYGSEKLAITREKARQLFGNESPIGKKINGDEEITAVVSQMSKRSNYAFDFIGSFNSYVLEHGWNASGGETTIIELISGLNIEAFEKKLYEHDTGEGKGNISKMKMEPLSKIRYTGDYISREIKFQHILIFALSGFLVILCSLFNYLTLFVSRFRLRQKELALRVVCGASPRSLLKLLSVEFVIMMLFAALLGGILTKWFYTPFLTLSEIQMNLSVIFLESLMYFVTIMIISVLSFWAILLIFRYRNLNLSIRRSNNKLFRKSSVIVQLIISTGFAFCTIVILKQMHFLHNTDDLGFSFKNRGTVRLMGGVGTDGVLANMMKQIPEITEVVDAEKLSSFIPILSRMSQGVSSWDEKPAHAGSIYIEGMTISPESAAFYDLRLLAGEMLTETDSRNTVLINESAVKAFGWNEPVGKSFSGYTVKGVIKNVYNWAPTIEAKPIFFANPSPESVPAQFRITTVLFKYREGTWKTCKEKIEKLVEQNFAYHTTNTEILFNAEEVYNTFLESEKVLIKLLFTVSAICILICIFGFVSLVSLTCEERRKEIAIRKVHGATVSDILTAFAKEYFLLLIIGAVIAFTASYAIMQRWLENYVARTNIPAWIYLSIVCVLALVIVLCVGWQVYKSSIENPAEVVKSE